MSLVLPFCVTDIRRRQLVMHAGLALAPPRESVLRDGLQQQQPTISLLLERRDEVSGERFTSLAVAPNETIQSVKLRVSKRSAFTSRHCLVSFAVHSLSVRTSKLVGIFMASYWAAVRRASSQSCDGIQVLGDRELLEDDVTVGELAVASAKQPATGSNMHLHIVCKLKDIESVSIATSMQRTLTFKNEDVSPQPIRRSKSALTALLSTSDRWGSACLPCGCVWTLRATSVLACDVRCMKPASSNSVLDFDRLDSDSPMAGGQLAMRRSPSLPPDGVVRTLLCCVQADSSLIINCCFPSAVWL